MSDIATKLEYLGTTKTQLKGMINYGLDENNKITNETTFRDYVKSIFKAFLESLNNPDTLFTNLPKKSQEGVNITLNDTANAPMKIKLSASEMSQSGTPTPESPQDIHTISESNTIEVAGKNVVNALDISSMINFTKDNNVFTSSALTSTGYGGIASTKFTNDVYIPNNSTIYISADIRLVSGTTETLNVIGDRSLLRLNASWVEKPTLSNQFQRYCYKYDVNAGDSFTGFFVQLYNCSNAVLEVKNVMFSYSNETEYEPYVSQEADIDLGVKNLYDFRNYKLANQSLLNRTELIDGSYQFTSTGSGYAYAQYNLSLPAGTYSYKIETDTGSNYTVLNGQTSVSNPFTINETTTIAFRIFIANAVAGNQVVLKNIILENGTKVQEASNNPIEYCKIGNYEDEFIRSNDGTWQLKKSIGKVVLDGSENWAYGGVTSIFYTTSITDYAISNNIPYSNYYKGVNNVTGAANMGTQNNNSISFINQSGQTTPRFYIKDTTYTSENDVKTWLSTHNTEVYYILATPTYTQITGTLAEQLENIFQKLKSYEGTTNISQVNNDLPFVLNVQALEDLE